MTRPETETETYLGDGPSAKTAEFWNRIADGYAEKPVADTAAYQRKLDITKERLSENDVLLDIGCGTGSLALELAPHVAEVHAVDLSREMVRIANEKAAAAGIDNVTFHNASVEQVAAFGPESFDVITAYNLLHLTDDLDATLAKIYGLLAPGGTFISTTPCIREGWVPYGLILPVMRWLGKAPHVLPLHASDVLGGMRDAGFVDVGPKWVSDSKTTLFALARKPPR